MRGIVQARSALLPQILTAHTAGAGAEARDALRRLSMLIVRSSAEAIKAFKREPRVPLVTRFDAENLALLRLGTVALLVAELRCVGEAIHRSRTVKRDSEIA